MDGAIRPEGRGPAGNCHANTFGIKTRALPAAAQPQTVLPLRSPLLPSPPRIKAAAITGGGPTQGGAELDAPVSPLPVTDHGVEPAPPGTEHFAGAAREALRTPPREPQTIRLTQCARSWPRRWTPKSRPG